MYTLEAKIPFSKIIYFLPPLNLPPWVETYALNSICCVCVFTTIQKCFMKHITQ